MENINEKKLLIILFSCALLTCAHKTGNENRNGDEIMEVNINYLKHYDLVFHVLAYLKVDNASNLYSDEYIKKMSIKKQYFKYDIIPKINLLQDYYNNNFERLSMINFLPFYSKDFNDLKNIYRNNNSFNNEDINYFINPFIDILENESVFYFEYWEKIHKNNKFSRNTIEDKFMNELKKYKCIFEYYNKKPLIVFSYSITNNGRGFGNDTSFSAVIPFPENDEKITYSFIQLLHEYTHQFTDNLQGTNINMKDDSHNLSEKTVILTDYYLIKILDNELIKTYLEMFFNNEKMTEKEILEILNINKKLVIEIKKLIDIMICIKK
jgi:hypothetical protein